MNPDPPPIPPPPRPPSAWTIVSAAILLLLALPVALPLAALSLARERRAMAGAIRGVPCSRCGTPLGKAAIALAEHHNADRVAAVLARGFIPRMAPGPDAICVGCGAAYRFRDRRLHPFDPAGGEPSPPHR